MGLKRNQSSGFSSSSWSTSWWEQEELVKDHSAQLGKETLAAPMRALGKGH